MTPKHLLAVLVLSMAVGPVVLGADWPKIEALNFTQRLAITVENPSDVPTGAGLVHIPLAELSKSLPDAKAGQVAVIDPTTPTPKRDAADQYFVPFQTSNGTLIFSVPLKAHEKKQLFVYTTPDAKAPIPGFAMGTGYDSRHAYRSFENNYAAFRIETGPGSNTTGMSIDLFGKTAAGKGLRLAELYQNGHDSYHELQYWGVDILKVGNGPGLGGIYLYIGDQMGRPAYQTISTECLYSGPVETAIRFSAPVEVAGRKLTVSRVLTLVAEDRSIWDEVTVEGDVSGVQIGIGVRDLPNCKWVEDPKRGIAFQTGDANQQHYKAVGLGCVFPPDQYVKTLELPNKADFGHIYVLTGKAEGGKLVSKHRLGAIWDMDGQLPKPVNTAGELTAPFASWIDAWAAQRDQPVRVEMAGQVETAQAK